MTVFVNFLFEQINGFVAKFFFFDVLFFTDKAHFPLVVFLLFICAVFFTFKMNFVNIRLFKKAWLLVFEKPEKGASKKEGEISHFKALTTALCATVGLGNIAGVAIAISIGGPGATFWMIFIGFLGMSTKFTECSLAVMYRERRADGALMGGPMEYLQKGIGDLGYPFFGKVLSILFCILCIVASLGGGVAFQVNQSLNAISFNIPFLSTYSWVYGLGMVIIVGTVIIGGIKRISQVASRIMPLMCGIYILMVLYILFVFYDRIPGAFFSYCSRGFCAGSCLWRVFRCDGNWHAKSCLFQ